MLTTIIIIGLLVVLYFLPCFVCSGRGATNGGTVFLVNLLFGWTLVGWLVALMIACFSQTKVSREIERETLRRLQQGQ